MEQERRNNRLSSTSFNRRCEWGEVVGLTAVYDKSVSVEELRSAIDKLYPKAAIQDLPGLWRVEAEQLAIQLSARKDGAKQLVYLKFTRRPDSLVPSAHIVPSK
jgi:hypothetical protein